MIYGKILMFVKTLGYAIFAAVSIIGMCIAFLPSVLLAKQESYYFADVVARSLRIIGVSSKAIDMIPGVSSISPAMPWTLDVSTFFLFSSLIMVAAIILSYPLSIMSSGYTIIYVILRKKTNDENLLEIEEEDIDMDLPAEPVEESEEKVTENEEETKEEE